MSGFYLNTQEYKLRKEWELVPFPRGEIMNFGHRLHEKVKNVPRTQMLANSDTIHTVFEKLQQILPIHPEDTEHTSTRKRLLKLNEMVPFEGNLELYGILLDWTIVILTEIDHFVSQHPEFFLPRSANQTPRTPVVRVFEEGDHRFVLIRELQTEMERSGMDSSEVQRLQFKTGAHGTLEFYPLPEIIGDQFGGIEFVGYKVRRTKHRAIFIPSFDGKYCVSSGDLILETMRDITSVSGYYRQYTRRMGDTLQNLFEQFEAMIFAVTRGSPFVAVEDAKELKTRFLRNVEIEMRRFPPIEPFQIRQISTDTLPFKTVMNEVKRLGIWKTQDSKYVTGTCEIICKKLNDSKSFGYKYTTADLHEVIEGIQMCCSIINYAKIFKLLHNSGHCRLIPQVCYYCCEDSYLAKMMPLRNKMMRRFDVDYSMLSQQQTNFLMGQAQVEAVAVMDKWMDKTSKTRTEEAKVEPPKPVSESISASMMPAFKAYLPEEHWNVVKVDNKRLVLNSKSVNMRFHGSKEELIGNVQTFLAFPGSRAMFGGGLAEQMTIDSVFYKSLRNQPYIFNVDIFKHLLKCIRDTNSSIYEDILPTISSYLKSKEASINGQYEFILFDKKALEDFQKNIALEKVEGQYYPKNLHGKEEFERLMEVINDLAEDPECQSVAKNVGPYLRRSDPSVAFDGNFYETWNASAFIIGQLDRFFVTYPQWLKGKPESVQSSGNGNQAKVRLFVDGDRKFILVWELQLEMYRARLDTSSIQDSVIGMSKIATVDFKEVVGVLGHQMDYIEFIVTPINRSTQCAVLIPSIDNNYLVPASEALLEVLHDLISVKSLFQEVHRQHLSMLYSVVELAVDFILENSEQSYFIDYEKFDELKKEISKELAKNASKLLEKKKREVQDIGQNGFTKKDLKNQLHQLGFVKTFPNIGQYVDRAYNKAVEEKKGSVLRACDMVKALEMCQIISVSGRIGKVIELLHKKGGCKRVWMDCNLCAEEPVPMEH
ncbi:unnamed protein product [Caenorhabditis brenneri]